MFRSNSDLKFRFWMTDSNDTYHGSRRCTGRKSRGIWSISFRNWRWTVWQKLWGHKERIYQVIIVPIKFKLNHSLWIIGKITEWRDDDQKQEQSKGVHLAGRDVRLHENFHLAKNWESLAQFFNRLIWINSVRIVFICAPIHRWSN